MNLLFKLLGASDYIEQLEYKLLLKQQESDDLQKQLEEAKVNNEQLIITINELENSNKDYLNYDKEFRTALSNQLQRLASDIVDCS